MLFLASSCTTISHLGDDETKYIGKTSTVLANASIAHWEYIGADTLNGYYKYINDNDWDIYIYPGYNASKIYKIEYNCPYEEAALFFVYLGSKENCHCDFNDIDYTGYCEDKKVKYLFDFNYSDGTSQVLMVKR